MAEETTRQTELPDFLILPLIKGHFTRMGQLLDNREPSKRVVALKNMRLEMKRRYMHLFKLFRHKKYGEPLDGARDSNSDLGELEDYYDKEDAAFIAKIKMMVKSKPIDYDAICVKKQDSQANQISDLESIKEDEEESDEFGLNRKIVRSKQEYEDHVFEKIEDTVVTDMLKDYLSKMLKIKEFLTEIALRRRFKKKQRAIIKIQAFLRVLLAKKQLRNLKTAKLEIKRGQ